jgi:di/tricarboxylate transporter
VGKQVPSAIAVQLNPPEQKDTPDAPAAADARLKEMGPMTTPQKVMAGTLMGAVVLWMFGDLIGVSAVVAAMMGLCVLLLSGVLQWKVCFLDFCQE